MMNEISPLMQILAHTSFPYLLFIIGTFLLGINVRGEHILLLLLFTMLPDLDLVVQFITGLIKKQPFDFNVNHHKWPSHLPIYYSPFIILFIFFPSVTTFVMMYGVYSHLLLDTLADSHGIMWFFPYSKKWFNYVAEKTRGKQGIRWLKAYSQTVFFKTEQVTFIVMLIHLVIR
jgi:hypothetical protein